MQEKEIKLLFDAGTLKQAIGIQAVMGSGYHLMLVRKDKSHIVLASQRESERLFSSADAVINTACRIGFQHIEFRFT